MARGRVRSIGSAPSLVHNHEFAAEIKARESHVKSVITRLTGSSADKFIVPEIRLNAQGGSGNIFTFNPRTPEPVVVSGSFPDAFGKISKIGERPITFAADYTLAYAMIVRALHAQRSTTRSPEPLAHPELWPVVYRETDTQRRFEMPYRFAARVMLDSANIETIAVPPNPIECEIPPVFSSVFDPYSPQAMRRFGDAIRYTVDMQERSQQNPWADL